MSKWWMVVAVGVMVVRTADADEPRHPLTIDLQMRNDARVPAHVLEQSQDEVTRIFADAGLTSTVDRDGAAIHRAHRLAGPRLREGIVTGDGRGAPQSKRF